ncbi:triose-phosphate isomerase [Candidatus Gracilibacteria bacterium CG2_30_37_12]|nr:MAG: triose-phosphate isomerase [Candidatus Gracilibacteria bacterium CG2_30_37_12]
MKLLIGANFKMNKTVAEVWEYLQILTAEYKNPSHVDLMIAPVSIGLPTASELLAGSNIHLGAQNIYPEISGPYTGEISPVMLQEMKCEYVILGHSERRAIFSETDELVNRKVKSALAYNIRPILCIGENLTEKEAGLTKEILRGQLIRGLDGIENTTGIDIAYEPVWAIGTGKSATPEYVEEIHIFIRELLGQSESRIIYGGSVSETSAHELIGKQEVNGFLIGSAALDPRRLIKIVEEATR